MATMDQEKISSLIFIEKWKLCLLFWMIFQCLFVAFIVFHLQKQSCSHNHATERQLINCRTKTVASWKLCCWKNYNQNEFILRRQVAHKTTNS